MTMFGKGTWTILNLESPELNLTNKLNSSWRLMPAMAKAIALNSNSEALAIAPYLYPRMGDVDELVAVVNDKEVSVEPDTFIQGDLATDEWTYDPLTNTIESKTNGSFDLSENKLWDNNAETWKIADGVYAFWMIAFQWSDVHDLSSKKEGLAYEYGAPFKFQTAEIKATITEEAEKLDTVTRKQFQVIVDFNLKRVWINSSNKNVVMDLIGLLADLDLVVEDWRPESDYNMEPQWTETLLKKLYDTSEYKAEFLARAAEIKLHGVAGVQPNEDKTLEKILKNYFSFSDVEDDFMALSGPLAVRLCPTVASTVTFRTPYEATEFLSADENLLLTAAPMTFCKLFEKTTANGSRQILIKRFTIEVNSNTMISEVPGFVVKGLNLDNFKNTIKQEAKALDRPLNIGEYWHLWYVGMNAAVFEYLNVVKEMMG